MLERLINADVDIDGDGYCEAVKLALDDRLLVGLGTARVRYEVETEEVGEVPAKLDEETGAELAPAVPATEKKSSECVELDYIPWKDFLWGQARTWGEVQWVAFRAEMTREECEARFGEKLGAVTPLKSKEKDTDGEKADPTARAIVWEVWEGEGKEVLWLAEGYGPTLLHAVTQKGKGYHPAESDAATRGHALSFFDVATGKPVPKKPSPKAFTDLYVNIQSYSSACRPVFGSRHWLEQNPIRDRDHVPTSYRYDPIRGCVR